MLVRLRKLVVVLGVLAGTAAIAPSAHAQSRDHRSQPPPPPTPPAPPPPPAPSPYPQQAPPAPQAENPGSKPGYVWVRGHWQRCIIRNPQHRVGSRGRATFCRQWAAGQRRLSQ